MGWDRVWDDMGMRENTGYRGTDGQGMASCSSSASGSQSSQMHFSLNRADANPMIWIVFLGARSEIPNPDFSALDLSPFPLLCHLTDSTLTEVFQGRATILSSLLSSHTVHRWSSQQCLLYRRGCGTPRRLHLCSQVLI